MGDVERWVAIAPLYDQHIRKLFQCEPVCPEEQPVEQRPRKVTPALKAYALLATSADKGAVRDLSKLD